jgi:hypothetical protein
MALFGRDANGNDAYIEASGDGTTASGFVTYHDTFTRNLKFAAVNLTASGDVIAAVAGAKLRVMSLLISSDAACSLKFQTDAAADISGEIYLPANGTVTLSNPLGLFEADTSDKLNAVLTGTANVGITLGYREVV